MQPFGQEKNEFYLNGQGVFTLNKSFKRASALCVHPNLGYVIWGTFKGEIYIYDTEKNKVVGEFNS
jgi:hypothetical protein